MFGKFFDKLKEGLTKTKDGFTDKISSVLNLAVTIDEDLYEELEEILVTADIGVDTSIKIIDRLRERVKEEKIKDPAEIKPCLKRVILEILGEEKGSITPDTTPKVMLVIGVNGVGKTTSIGKVSAKLKDQGYKVIMAAADTFRAAAIEQLTEWANRAKVDIISHKEGSDPASVVFDGVSAMKSRDADILICDTAGRLHNKKNLMNELNKIKRVIEKEYPEAKKEILLIVDGTTGQNAIIQAKEFMNATDLTGAIITKLDGTAKGGMIFPLEMELGIPVKFIGIGEQVNDLVKFEPEKFIEAIIN